MNKTKLAKPIALFLLVILSLFAFAGCGPSGPPSIGEVVSAKSLDADYKPINPTTTYQPGDEFQLSVEVKNLAIGSVVTVKYSVDGQPYEESTLKADKQGSGYYGFSLKSGVTGHQPGSYKAEVYLDGVLAKTAEFNVEQAGPPSLTKVVFAKALDRNNRPTNLTASYTSKEKMYVCALGENLIAGSKVEIKVIYEGQEISDSFDVTNPGTQYFTLTVDPSADGGHPLGDYTVEVYLDDSLATTSNFSVR
jgi:hypothetical protein